MTRFIWRFTINSCGGFSVIAAFRRLFREAFLPAPIFQYPLIIPDISIHFPTYLNMNINSRLLYIPGKELAKSTGDLYAKLVISDMIL